MQMFIPSAKRIPKWTGKDTHPPLSAIESIPNEILIRVMQYTVSDPVLPLNPFSTVLKLSHVSRHFRSIAHGTSEFWTLIRPKFPLEYDQVTYWLDVLTRTGMRSIDIVIDIPAEHPGAIEPYETLLGAIVGHSDRWRKLEIMSRAWEPIETFLHQSKHPTLLPRLEELIIRHSGDSGQTVNQEDGELAPRVHNPLFGKDPAAPMLRTVKLGATYFDYSRMRSLAKDLVELHLENHTYHHIPDVPEMIIDFLRASPNLQVLVLTGLNVQFTNQPEPVELPYLRRLEFRGFPDNARHLLPLLRVPALEVLYLGECQFVTDPGSRTIMPRRFVACETMRFMIRLFTENLQPYWRADRLSELSLEYNECLEREVTRFLRLTPNVGTFHIACSAIFPILADNPQILPNLKHLVVQSSIFYDPYPISAILTNRPGVTLSVEGNLTQAGERLYDTLKDAHDITLRA